MISSELTLIPQRRISTTEENKNSQRQSMFGLTKPIAHSRRTKNLDDFDGIRSILSQSTIQDSWSPFVQEDGSLFYVLVNDTSNDSNIPLENCSDTMNSKKGPFNRPKTQTYTCSQKNEIIIRLSLQNNPKSAPFIKDNIYEANTEDANCVQTISMKPQTFSSDCDSGIICDHSDSDRSSIKSSSSSSSSSSLSPTPPTVLAQSCHKQCMIKSRKPFVTSNKFQRLRTRLRLDK